VGISQIDFKLEIIQEVIGGIADALYDQNVFRSRELKVQSLNLGCVRADLGRAVAENGIATEQSI